ncbi:MAG: hypothetical protein IT378_25555, partial [Sandaracinaceae bacterium]|nr:hypothetical protein [Sandaracinaceae bacterium]
AVTGALAGESLVAVGGIAEKLAAVRARPSLQALIVPRANEAEARAHAGSIRIVAVGDADELLREGLAPGGRERPDRAMDRARLLFATGWRGYRWPFVREGIAALVGVLPAGRADLRVEALARLAAVQRHLGDPVGSRTLLVQALELAEREAAAVPDAPLSYALQQLAMTERQLCRFGDAAKAAARAIRVARRARLRGELIKALGCAGFVARSRERRAEAVDVFTEALDLGKRHDPDDTARSHAYLIEALGEAGHEAAARLHFHEALREVASVADAEERRARESWVRTSWAAGLAALDRPREVLEVLEVPAVRASLADEPLPGLLARRYLGAALVATGQRERGLELLAAAPAVHGRALEPHLRFVAQLDVRVEMHARAGAGALGPDAIARARAALDAMPVYAGRWLAVPRARAERALGSGRSLERALAALIARATRIV